ncbi:hypothetical protein AB835_14575 [Candidatus Endobugula sertula]|uniref:Protein kinase domain-containing protein n=1 Tax=Candidatus Endobugula sertula TaxID=62101 RepID=A0A1D2QLB7_9GAMM|nr:hypothetical protein AB835_14575 [Candidatus Endobugula sertula]
MILLSYQMRSIYRWMTVHLTDLRRILFVFWVFFKHCSQWLFPPYNSHSSFYVLLRQAIEELGLTYLKLGQFLAMRFDILPPPLSQELSLLFEAVSPMPFDQAKQVIEYELEQPLEALFAEFDPQSIAAASVGQVHIAKTHTGETVAVKIQREGIRDIFESDMRIMARLAQVVDYFNLLGGLISASDTVSEFSSWTRGELDFQREGHVAERLQIALGHLAKVPKIHKNLSNKHVLTMEFIEGYTLARVFKIIEQSGVKALYTQVPELDLEIFGKNLVKTVLYQLFVSGIFHGDPHPGNLIVCQDNRVGLVDFGIFGELQHEQQTILARQIETISIGDINGCFRCIAKQYYPSDETDFDAFEQDAKTLLRQWYQASLDPDSSLKEQHLGNHSAELMEAARRHGLRGGTNTLLFWRSLYVLDATALKLRDHFNLFEEMHVFFTEYRSSLPQILGNIFTPKDYQHAAISVYQQLPHHLNMTDKINQNQIGTQHHTIQASKHRQNEWVSNHQIGILLISVFIFTGIYFFLTRKMVPLQALIADLLL